MIIFFQVFYDRPVYLDDIRLDGSDPVEIGIPRTDVIQGRQETMIAIVLHESDQVIQVGHLGLDDFDDHIGRIYIPLGHLIQEITILSDDLIKERALDVDENEVIILRLRDGLIGVQDFVPAEPVQFDYPVFISGGFEQRRWRDLALSPLSNPPDQTFISDYRPALKIQNRLKMNCQANDP